MAQEPRVVAPAEAPANGEDNSEGSDEGKVRGIDDERTIDPIILGEAGGKA